MASRPRPLRGSPRRSAPRHPARRRRERGSTSAPAASARTLLAMVAPSRSSTSRPVSLPRKLLREVPTTSGRPSSRSSPRRRRSSRLWSPSFRSRSRIDPDVAPRRPPRRSQLDPLREEGPDVVDDVVVAGVVLHGSRVPEHVHEDDCAVALRAQTARAPGPRRRAVTSLTIAAPASRGASATAGFDVSIESCRVLRPWGRQPPVPPPQLLLRAHRLRIRPRRLAADVEDVRAGRCELPAVPDRPLGLRRSAPRPRTSRG